MRTTLVAGILASLLLATPAQASTYGPDSGVAGTPTYTPQSIRVIDAMWVREDHLQKWYVGRNDAFAQWALPFSIELGTVPVRWTDENINNGTAITDIVPNAIVIVRNYSTACENVGGWVEELGGGIVAVCPWAPWWKDSGQTIAQTVAHEAGHAIGFAHGGTGVMAGSLKVNAEERSIARTYYESLGFIF